MINVVEFILFIRIVILILIVLIAAYFDLKYKKIPNLLTFTTVLFGLIINLVYSILIKEITLILNSFFVSIIIFILSYCLWKFRIWGGGDVKLLTAISVVLPIHPALLSNLFKLTIMGIYLPKIAIYPFPFTVIMNSILISFPFLISILLFNYMKNIYNSISFNQNQKYQKFYLKIIVFNKFFNNFNNFIKYFNLIKLFKFFYFIKYILKLLISKIKFNINHSVYKLKKEGLFYLNFKKLSTSLVISSIFLIIILFLKNYKFTSFISFAYIIIIGMILSFIFSFLIKYFISNFNVFIKKSSYENIYFEDLEEGMILDEVYVDIEKIENILSHSKNNNKNINIIINNYNDFDNNDNICNVDNINYFDDIDKIDNYYNINFNKKNENHLIRSKTAAGLTKYDIIILKSLSKSKIIPKYLPIKLGIPFAPSIAIGTIISIFIGDLILLFFTAFNSYMI